MLHRLSSGILLFLATTTLFSSNSNVVTAKDWSIPLAGNIYQLSPNPFNERPRRDTKVVLSDNKKVFATYFHVDKPAKLELELEFIGNGKPASLELSVGDQKFPVQVTDTKLTSHKLGTIGVDKAGYVQVQIRKTDEKGSEVEIPTLRLSSVDESLSVAFVRDNEGGMFYWGRRGPSVHLRYGVPKDKKIQFAYSEITVPKGDDILGTYYMANGFGEGYFGFQVNSPKERRVLFSVWSPYTTDNPKDIPEDQRIVKLASGPGVHVGEFGNEGSGGQSYLNYPWVAGKTYRFLTEVKPDGDSHTIYTSWFGDKDANEWRLIASFRRPKISTYYRGFHSFLENFNPQGGHLPRGAYYGNQWVRDVDGVWHECTEAVLTVDNTGRQKHRVDYAGGSEDSRFFMRNCGFEQTNGVVDQSYTRTSTKADQPDIEIDKLPKQ